IDYAALLRESGDHLIRHVARHVGQRAARGVGREHGSVTDGERVPESLVRHVRNIDHHAQTIHFTHDVLAEIREAVVMFYRRIVDIARGVRPIVRIRMREGHVPHSQRIVVAQKAEIVFNRMAALYTDQRRDLVALVRCNDLIRRGAKSEIVWISCNDIVANGVDHIEGPMGGMVAWHVTAGYVGGEKDGAYAALAQPG